MRRGLDVDQFVPQLSFFFNAHNDFFEEIAKYRAARRIWHKAMVERYKSKNPRSWALRFHTQTAGCSLTAQQPYNNVVRTAIQALAAVLGGTQSLHTNSLDEAWALPTEFAATIALRTQQIIADEKPLDILQIDETVAHRQAARLKKLRADRSQAEVDRRLNALRAAAKGKENLMPFLYDAVKSYATLGEICDALRDVFGTYEEVAIT